MPKTPSVMGAARWVFSGLPGCVLDGFSFGCKTGWPFLLAGGFHLALQSEIIYGSVIALFRVVVGFLLVVPCIQRLRVVDQASTESLILAQDERWRRA